MSSPSRRLRLGLLCGLLAFAVGILGSSQHLGVRLVTVALVLVVYAAGLRLAPRWPRAVAVVSVLLAVGGVLPPYNGRFLAIAALSAAELGLSLSTLLPTQGRSTDRV